MALPLPWRSSTSASRYISNSRRIRLVGIISVFALVLLGVATIAPLTKKTEYTEAATGTASETTLTIATTDYPTLDLSVNNLGGTFTETTAGSGQGSFSVTTTNYTGYTLSISASDNTGTLVNSSDSTTSIASIGSATGESTVPATGIPASTFNTTAYNGMWGYKPSKLNSAANTNYLPAPTTTATTIDETSVPNTTANNYTIDLAARLQYTQNSGTYSKTFILTAVANKINYSITYNPSASTPSDVTNMPSPNPQSGDTNSTEITLSASTPTREGYTFKGWCTASTGTDGTDTCSGTTYQPTAPDNVFPIDQTTINTTTLYAMWEKDIEEMQYWRGCSSMSIGDTVTLKDSRDDKKYLVGKLKKSASDSGTTGGWCWMLENLALDIADSTVQGKMTSSTTNASDVQLGYLKNGGGSSPNTYYAVSKAWNSSNTTNYYDRPLINVDSINTVPSTKYGSGSGKVGVYYNYCAASAGTYCYSLSSSSSNASADVCPAGWRLPTSGSVDTNVTPNLGEFQTLYSAYGSNHTNFTTALSTPLSGVFGSGFAHYQGSDGYWWSSTYNNSTIMFYLYVGTSNVNPQDVGSRDRGFPIRCILKSDAEIIPETETMQSVTDDQLATIMPNEGSTSSLRDARDDQVYTLSKINGNYWMTRNLAIGCNGTGSTYGSTITGKALTPANSNISSDWTLPTTAFDSSNNSATSGYTTVAMQCNSTYGGYYNHAAATAGTIANASDVDDIAEAQYSICPKGWRLPSRNEFSGITSSSSTFSPVYSGYYDSGTLRDSGSTGYWWSSTADNSTYRYRLEYNNGSLGVSRSDRYFGFSVRCVRKSDAEIAWEEAGRPTMQNFTSADASTMNTGDTKVLADTRDNQLYTVSKLADGRVWMLDNLALGSTSTMKLTNSDTNITASSWTLPAGITSGFNSYTAAQINIDSKNVVPTPTYGTASNKVGVYYNYCAASAGGICTNSNSYNGSPNRDICPKGWRLPTGGPVDTSVTPNLGEFQTLYNAYGNHSAFTTALSTPLSGIFSSGSAGSQGSSGYWWSSTRYYNTDMYLLNVNASNVYLQSGVRRNDGFPIRCILK